MGRCHGKLALTLQCADALQPCSDAGDKAAWGAARFHYAPKKKRDARARNTHPLPCFRHNTLKHHFMRNILNHEIKEKYKKRVFFIEPTTTEPKHAPSVGPPRRSPLGPWHRARRARDAQR